MSEQSVFKDLSRYMPDKEREELLNRLKKSLFVPDETEEKKYHKEIDRNEREEHLTKDLNKVSWISRIILWIKSKLSGKSVREMYLNTRIKQLKKGIASKFPGYTGFETRDLSPKVAEAVFSIYVLTVPLRDIYRRMWMNTEDFEGMLMTLLEGRIPNVKKTLHEFIPNETLEKIFSDKGTKEAMRGFLSKKLDVYFDSIPAGVFKDLERDLMPITCTKDLVLYQYKAFFQLFHFTPLDEDLGKKTFFKSASAMLCLQHLERLHFALSQVMILRDAPEIPGDIMEYLTVLKKSINEEIEEKITEGLPNDNGDETDDAPVDIDVSIATSLKKLTLKAISVFKALPLSLLVKYFMKDPYHELTKGVPELRLQELYISVLRLKVVAELEKVFPEIRKQVVTKEIQELFDGKTMIHFRNYREYESIDYRKLELPFFRFTRSIHLLFNYVRHFYKDFVREAVQVLERGILSQNRITRDRLLQYAAAVEDIENKTVTFDYSLSPDSEDGKLFQRLRFTLAQDKSHRRMYRTLVLQKDREVQVIITRGVEAISGLCGVFDEIVNSRSEGITSQLTNNYFVKGKPVSLEQILIERRDHQKRFVDLLSQVFKLEKG